MLVSQLYNIEQVERSANEQFSVGTPETHSRIRCPFAGNTTDWTLDFSIIGIASIEKSRTAEDCTESGQATTEG
jgi:hypothetical protein